LLSAEGEELLAIMAQDEKSMMAEGGPMQHPGFFSFCEKDLA